MPCSSYMLSIDAGTSPAVDLRFWAATSDPAEAATASGTTVCSTSVTVTGGRVSGAPTAGPITGASCPAGSWDDSGKYCPACPTGHHCTGGAKTACVADKFNQLLGQTAVAACDACYTGTVDARTSTDYTSLAGAYSCTIPYVRIDCAGEWARLGCWCGRSCVPALPARLRALPALLGSRRCHAPHRPQTARSTRLPPSRALTASPAPTAPWAVPLAASPGARAAQRGDLCRACRRVHRPI